jgi:hypothetical protein
MGTSKIVRHFPNSSGSSDFGVCGFMPHITEDPALIRRVT